MIAQIREQPPFFLLAALTTLDSLSTSIALLIGARAFQGVGAAVLVSCLLARAHQSRFHQRSGP
jgi:hypothetical protein